MAQKELDQIFEQFMNLPENSRSVSQALGYFDSYAKNLSDIDSYSGQEEFDRYISNLSKMYSKYIHSIRKQFSRN